MDSKSPKNTPDVLDELMGTHDREVSLANKFDDPLSELIQQTTEPQQVVEPTVSQGVPGEEQLHIIDETASAVHDLMAELKGAPEPTAAAAPTNPVLELPAEDLSIPSDGAFDISGEAFDLTITNPALTAPEDLVSMNQQMADLESPKVTQNTGSFELELGQITRELVIEKEICPTTEANKPLVAAVPLAKADPVSTHSQEDVSLLGNENSESAQFIASWQMARTFFGLVVADVPFESLMEKILQNFISSVGASAGSILELDAPKGEFFFRAAKGGGDPDKLRSFRVPATKGIVGHVYESRQILLLNDLDDNQMQLRAISMSTGFETKSCLAAPIIVANTVYGVIELFNKQGMVYFDESDKRLLEDGVKMAAKVLEVRFLMAELLKRGRK